MCVDFTKMAPKIKVKTFFGVYVLFQLFSGTFRGSWANLGEIWAKMVLEVL